MRILAALEERTASPSELAGELNASLGVVSYHVRRLVAFGFVEPVRRVPRRGAVEHYYTTTTRPRIPDAIWGAAPRVVQQATIMTALQQIGSYVTAAAAGAAGLSPLRYLESDSPGRMSGSGVEAESASG